MSSNGKRDIKGPKTTEKKYKGKVRKIIKAIIAVALAVGLTITSQQAIKMFNQWAENKKLDNLDSIIATDKGVLSYTRLEEFETILEEYKQAVKNGNVNRQKELDKIVVKEKYFDTIKEEVENSIIKELGYSPEDIEIIMGRDGFFLADKEKLKESPDLYNTGEVSNRVKVYNEKNELVEIAPEMKEILQRLLNDGITSKGVYSAAKAYKDLVELKSYKTPDITKKDEGIEFGE